MIFDIKGTKERIITAKEGLGRKITVGLCSGCFDFVHAGHVQHFVSAKKHCDYLVVAISNDESVNKRKGDGRPIFKAVDSAKIIGNLKPVASVIINPYDNSVNLIKELKPDFYIKGPDYKNKQTPGIVAERKAIKSVGGKMKYTSDSKYSTTKILDKIRTSSRKKVLYILDRDGTLIDDVGYLGKKDNWRKQVKYKDDVINFLLAEKTRNNATFIVVSNQTGVARKFFGEERVCEVNDYIDKELKKRGIEVLAWKYCPDADWYYAFRKARTEGVDFDLDYVFPRTARKPSPQMVWELIDGLCMKPEEFDELVVVGDHDDDKGLAKNIGATFINVKKKGFDKQR